MTKKHMDDRLRVCFPVTPKSSKSCTHSDLLHFLLQNTYLFVKINNKYYLFCYEKRSAMLSH